MDNKNKLTPLERAVRVSCVLYAISVITIFLAIFRINDFVLRFTMIGVSVTIILFTTLFLASMIYMSYHINHKKNYFLYDKKIKGNIPTDSLNFKFVREKVMDYMQLFKRGKKLYVGELFKDFPWSMEAMKTLLCYELLYELSEQKNTEACKMFLGYGAECSGLISKFLTENKDFEFGAKISEFFTAFKGDSETAKEFSGYIASQKEHIEKQMLEYTKRNIDKFMF